MIYKRNNNAYIEEKESLLLKILYNTFLGRLILKIFTYRWFTNLGGLILNSRFSKIFIKSFIRKNRIDMNEYIQTDYKSFDDFFTRKIKKDRRKLNKDNSILISPCDSKLSIYNITTDQTFKIKNSIYTVAELLDDPKLAKKYNGGYCLVFRLCVDDYHHYHYIDDGILQETKIIRGKFHTVRPIAHKKVKVFSENTREWNLLKTKNFGDIIQIEVGAMMVGKICNLKKQTFKKGDEKGYFRFGGSTVALLFEKNKIVLDEDIMRENELGNEIQVKLFEKIGTKKDK